MVAPLTPRNLDYVAARDAYIAEFGKQPTLRALGERMGICGMAVARHRWKVERWERWQAVLVKTAPLRAVQAERTKKRLYIEAVCKLIGKAADQHAKARRFRDDRVAWLEERKAEITEELGMLRKKRTLRTTFDLAEREKKRIARKQAEKREQRELYDPPIAHVRAWRRHIDQRIARIAKEREAAQRAKEARILAEHASLAAQGLATPIRFVRDTIFTIQPDGYWYPFPHLRVEPIE